MLSKQLFFFLLTSFLRLYLFFFAFSFYGASKVSFFFPRKQVAWDLFFFFRLRLCTCFHYQVCFKKRRQGHFIFFFPCELWSKRAFFFSRFLIFLSPIEINGFSVPNIRFPFVDILSPQDVLRTFAVFFVFFFFWFVLANFQGKAPVLVKALQIFFS